MTSTPLKCLSEKKILVSFGDTDPQGFIYFARAFEFAHQGIEEWATQSPLGWAFWFQNAEFAVPVRHAEADFLAPMRVGGSYFARLFVGQVGETSVTFKTEFFDPSSDQKLAEVTSTHAFVDKKTFKKITVPERVREVLR